MSVEMLRRAAALIRERAEAATADVCPEWTRNAVRHIARNCEIECAAQHKYGDAPVTVPHDHYGDSEATWSRYDDAEHIASWHPGVAVAVAELIAFVAEVWQDDTECRSPIGPDEPCGACANCDQRWTQQRALAAARAYLGEQP